LNKRLNWSNSHPLQVPVGTASARPRPDPPLFANVAEKRRGRAEANEIIKQGIAGERGRAEAVPTGKLERNMVK
jgi:hypothetical protein